MRILLSFLIALLVLPCAADNVRNYHRNAFTGEVDTNAMIIRRISTNILADGGVYGSGVPVRAPRSPWTNYLAPGFYSVSNISLRTSYVINVTSAAVDVTDYTNLLHSGFNTYVVVQPTMEGVVGLPAALSAKAGTNEARSVSFSNPANVFHGDGSNLTGIADGGGEATNVFFLDTATVEHDTVGGSNAFNVVGSALTGIPPAGVTGLPAAIATINTNVPSHLNLDRLYRWRDTLMHSNRPFRLYLTMDQNSEGADFPGRFAGHLSKFIHFEGAQFQGGGAAGAIVVAATNAPQESQDDSLFIGTTLTPYRLTNGSSLTFSRIHSGDTTGRSNILASTGHIIYLAHPDGGTFTLQTNLNEGSWGTYAVVADFQAGATNLLATNLTLVDGYYRIRVLGDTGTNRVWGGGMWHNTNKVLAYTGTLLNSGPSTTNWMGSISGILPEWFAIMQPDLFIHQDTGPDAVAISNAWNSVETMLTNASPLTDVVIASQFHFTTSTDTEVINTMWRNQAKRYARGYFDMNFYVPNTNTAGAWVDRGLILSDGIHLSATGGLLFGNRLWDAMIGDSLLLHARTSERNFNGEFAAWLKGRFGPVTASGQVWMTNNLNVLGPSAAVQIWDQNSSAANQYYYWYRLGLGLHLADPASGGASLLSVSNVGGGVVTLNSAAASAVFGNVNPFTIHAATLRVRDGAYFTNATGSRVAMFNSGQQLTNTATTGPLLGTGLVAAGTDIAGVFTGSGDYLKSDGTKGDPAGSGDLLAANNLSDVDNVGTARTNLVAHDAANLTIGIIPDARMPNLTGDVTTSEGAVATTIANSAVTLAKMANLAQDQFIGRTTASTGVPETATITAAARTVLDDATVAAMVDTLGGAASTGTGGLVRSASPTFTGTLTADTAEVGNLTFTNLFLMSNNPPATPDDYGVKFLWNSNSTALYIVTGELDELAWASTQQVAVITAAGNLTVPTTVYSTKFLSKTEAGAADFGTERESSFTGVRATGTEDAEKVEIVRAGAVIVTIDGSGDVAASSFAGSFTGNGSGLTNLLYTPNTTTLFNTNAAILTNCVSFLALTNNVRFTNWAAIAVSGQWFQVCLTNNTGNNYYVDVPTNGFTRALTNATGSYVVADASGTNFACLVTNGQRAVLSGKFVGGNLNAGFFHFRHW